MTEMRKYWEIISDDLPDAGWNWGFTSSADATGRTLFNVDAPIATIENGLRCARTRS